MEIYQVEVGVLLDETDEEFESYNGVFDNKWGYYNENLWFCYDLDDAKESALNYAKNGVEKTYAIISKINGFDKNEYKIESGNVIYKDGEMDCSEEFTDYSLEAVVHSYCKIKNEILNFLKR